MLLGHYMDNTKQRNIKIYQRYCGGSIVTGFLALALVGVFVAALFVPMFVYAGNGAEPVYVNGIDLIVYSFRDTIFKDVYLANPKLQSFDYTIGGYSQANGIYQFIRQNHAILEIVLTGIFTIAILFALVVAILGFVFLVAGRLRNPILPSALSSSAFFFFVLFLGLGFLYFFLCHNMLIEMGASQWVMIHYFSFILLGGVLIIMVLLNISYHVSFKGRRFAGSVSNVSINEFKPKHLFDANNQDPTNLPYGLKEIGEEAFAMNTDLITAHIPDGIFTLGAGAFSNCLNLQMVTIPLSVMEIGSNCFYNTPNLRQINYQGTMEDWEAIYKGENWMAMSGVQVINALDGQLVVVYEQPQ